MFTKFYQNLSICSEDIEEKHILTSTKGHNAISWSFTSKLGHTGPARTMLVFIKMRNVTTSLYNTFEYLYRNCFEVTAMWGKCWSYNFAPKKLIRMLTHLKCILNKNQGTSGPVNAHLTPDTDILMLLYMYTALGQRQTTP